MPQMIRITPPADVVEIDVSHVPHTAFVQPDGECTHCGEQSDDLQPRTVAGYGAVVDEKLCPECRDRLAEAPDFVNL